MVNLQLIKGQWDDIGKAHLHGSNLEDAIQRQDEF